MRSKLLILLVLSLVIFVATSLWRYSQLGSMTKNEAITWIADMQSTQFCSKVYPQISKCVTFKVDSCPGIIKENVQACTDQMQDKLESKYSSAESKELYTQVGACLNKKVHDLILQQYLIQSDECRAMMS